MSYPCLPVPGLPKGYRALLEDIKAKVRTARVKVAFSANRGLIELYWNIGRSIVLRQKAEGWGRSVVERLGRDLQKAFPGMRGFSPQNIWHMRAFYLTWGDSILPQPVGELGAPNLARPVPDINVPILQRPVSELDSPILQRSVREMSGSILQRPAGELDVPILLRPVTEIPWGHNIVLMEKLRSPATRLWYARQTLEHGWSRPVLVHHIQSRVYERQGKALTNFKRTLPPPQSDLAQEIVKDPYTFDFLDLGAGLRERDLERGLLDHVQRFLLELGAGFAFVGRQVPLAVGGQDFCLDLLFYHLRLRCFIVIELKAGEFKPEHAGKMNFYLSAVDDRLRHEDDRPSVGIILCRSRNRLIVEYALRDAHKPIGVSAYRLTRSLPGRLRGRLPSAAQIEAALGGP